MRAARAVAAGVFAATVLVRLTASGGFCAAGAALAALAAGAARPRSAVPNGRWRIGANATVFVSAGGVGEAPAEAVFASPGLIVLRHGREETAVWRDAAPPAAFRRLSAAVRWPSAHARVAPIDERSDVAGRT